MYCITKNKQLDSFYNTVGEQNRQNRQNKQNRTAYKSGGTRVRARRRRFKERSDRATPPGARAATNDGGTRGLTNEHVIIILPRKVQLHARARSTSAHSVLLRSAPLRAPLHAPLRAPLARWLELRAPLAQRNAMLPRPCNRPRTTTTPLPTALRMSTLPPPQAHS